MTVAAESTLGPFVSDRFVDGFGAFQFAWPDSTEAMVLEGREAKPQANASLYTRYVGAWDSWFGLSSIGRLLGDLNRIRNTDADDRWPGCDWPSDRAFDDAASFIRRLPMSLVLMPDLGIADDGEVNFLWDSGPVHIDVGFYGTGTYSVFARDEGDEEYLEDELPVVDGLPSPVQKLITV